MDNNSGRKLRALVWAGSVVAVFAVLIAIGAAWLLYGQTIELLTDNLRQRLLSISITEATNINGESLNALQDEGDWVKPEWTDVVSRLKRAKDENPNIVFMYIFRKDVDNPGQMEFVADAESINPYANTDDNASNDVDANGDGAVEPDGADKLQWPGQPYPEAVDIPEAYEAYNGALTAAELYEDTYGRVLTGYAPIKDRQGNVVAILATDIKADDFLTVTRQTLYPFLVFIGFLTLIIGVLSITLILLWERRAKMLSKLSSELEFANQRQESLLHFISHEIKGYLTDGQNAFAGIVEKDYGEPPAQLLDVAKGALSRMRDGVTTVMSILDASNLKKGTVAYKKDRCDFKSAVEAEVNKMKPKAAAKGLSLDVTIDQSASYACVGDIEKISEHVIRNLIDNAIRYTPQGSIHVSLSARGKSIVFTVKDTGVGIAPEDRPKLFTEGGHGKDSIKVNVDSTGYGLFIAKQVIEVHGGTIRVESEGAGKGSEFIVEIPAA